MKVYTLDHKVDYEGDYTIGIYSTQEVARKYAEEYMEIHSDYMGKSWEEFAPGKWRVHDRMLRIDECEVVDE